jgi:hypothetical protein
MLTEIYLCHTCSYQEILRMETPAQAPMDFTTAPAITVPKALQRAGLWDGDDATLQAAIDGVSLHGAARARAQAPRPPRPPAGTRPPRSAEGLGSCLPHPRARARVLTALRPWTSC